MTDVQTLFREMESLSLNQLERLHEFISTRPYKLEKREPTKAELNDVLNELRRIVAEPQEQKEDDAIARVEAMMAKRKTG